MTTNVLTWDRGSRLQQQRRGAGNSPQIMGISVIVNSRLGVLSQMAVSARSFARLLVISVLTMVSVCSAAEKPRIQVNDYVIHAVITPQNHQIKAQARVKFTALDDITIATFELRNALRPTSVLDANGQALTAERVSQDSTVRISLPGGLSKGASTTLTFEYEG